MAPKDERSPVADRVRDGLSARPNGRVHQEQKEIGRTVAAINEEVRTGALSTSSKPETIRDRADELTMARNMTESLCEALDRTLTALKDQSFQSSGRWTRGRRRFLMAGRASRNGTGT